MRVHEEKMNEQNNEITISLGDMFAYFLHRWKLIVIVSLILMVGIGGFLIYRQYESIQNKYEDATYNLLTRDMTQEQLRSVDLYYTRYKTYQERIRENQFYADNSLYMKLDANNVGVLTEEYLVKTDYSGVMSSFSDVALDLNDYEKMANILGSNIDARYVNELVSLNGSLGQDAYQIDTDKVGDVINGSIGNSYTGILTLRIIANTRSDCDELAKIADDAIREHEASLKGAGIALEVSALTTSYTERYDSGIAEYQRTKSEQGSQLVTDYYNFEQSAKSSMDEQERAVFNFMIEKEQEVKEKMHYFRYAAIGLVVGGLVIVIILAINYLFAPGVKTIEDAGNLTKEKGIGIIVQKTKSRILLGKFFHSWAKKIEFHGVTQVAEEEALALVCDRLYNLCESRNTKKLFVASDADCTYTGRVLKQLIELLKAKGIEAGAGSPVSSLEALQNLRGSEAVVMALTIKNSLPNAVRDEYAICEENNIPVLGNFIIYPQT